MKTRSPSPSNFLGKGEFASRSRTQNPRQDHLSLFLHGSSVARRRANLHVGVAAALRHTVVESRNFSFIVLGAHFARLYIVRRQRLAWRSRARGRPRARPRGNTESCHKVQKRVAAVPHARTRGIEKSMDRTRSRAPVKPSRVHRR